jgi:hypothetical protein
MDRRQTSEAGKTQGDFAKVSPPLRLAEQLFVGCCLPMLFDAITPDKIARPAVMKGVTAFVLPYVTRIRQSLQKPASKNKQIPAKTSKYQQIRANHRGLV